MSIHGQIKLEHNKCDQDIREFCPWSLIRPNAVGFKFSQIFKKQYFMVGGEDGFIRIYDKTSGEFQRQLAANNPVAKLFVVNETLVAICGDK
jgi:hypothetical protein